MLSVGHRGLLRREGGFSQAVKESGRHVGELDARRRYSHLKGRGRPDHPQRLRMPLQVARLDRHMQKARYGSLHVEEGLLVGQRSMRGLLRAP